MVTQKGLISHLSTQQRNGTKIVVVLFLIATDEQPGSLILPISST